MFFIPFICWIIIMLFTKAKGRVILKKQITTIQPLCSRSFSLQWCRLQIYSSCLIPIVLKLTTCGMFVLNLNVFLKLKLMFSINPDMGNCGIKHMQPSTSTTTTTFLWQLLLSYSPFTFKKRRHIYCYYRK